MPHDPFAESAAAEPKVLSVSDVTRDIRAILESAFDALWVEGEISNLRVAASQHAYFVLKDERAQIRCVMFRGQRTGMKFQPRDGDQVMLSGRISVYDARGEYQVIVERMEPRGLGALQKAFEQLKEKLAKEGLFDAAHKKPLPAIPWKIGVITSPTGAVIRDIIHVTQRRNPKMSILLYPVKVQGEGASAEIANAIRDMNLRDDIDVLIVGRGGGSIEDLWAFNEEVVARAIHASRIPVVSAVGHEVDYTIADFVADVRAPTPSAAAEIVVPLWDDLLGGLRDHTERLIEDMRGHVKEHKDNLLSLIDRRFFREPREILQYPAQRTDELTQRLVRGLERWGSLQRERLTGLAQRLFFASPGRTLAHWEEKRAALNHRLEQKMSARTGLAHERFQGLLKNLNALNPLGILERGFSLCTLPATGKTIKSSAEVQVGDPVRVRLARGAMDCRVEKTLE
jgi:exodeoxyribonuclease VII large subunit